MPEQSIRSFCWLFRSQQRRQDMKGILLWLVGVPIPVIILLYLFNVIN
jgi:hypothetical protein